MEQYSILDIENVRIRVYKDHYDFSVIKLWKSEIIQLWAICAITLVVALGTGLYYMILQGIVTFLFLFMFYKKHIQHATLYKKDIQRTELNTLSGKLQLFFTDKNGKPKEVWLRLPRQEEQIEAIRNALLFHRII